MHHDRPSGAADSPPGTQRAWRCVGDLWKVANDLNIRNIWSPSYRWSCWLRPGGLSLAELLGLRCLKWNKAYLWGFGLGGKKVPNACCIARSMQGIQGDFTICCTLWNAIWFDELLLRFLFFWHLTANWDLILLPKWRRCAYFMTVGRPSWQIWDLKVIILCTPTKWVLQLIQWGSILIHTKTMHF